MFKEVFLSFKDNLIQKAKNPFLGIYTIVWSIRNWELVYSLFNFDKDVKRDTKITFIKKHFEEMPFIENILWNILIATGVLIATYLLLNISRLIVNLFEKRLSPWISKITVSNLIVAKEDYDIVKNRTLYLEKRVEELKKDKSYLLLEVDRLENEVKEFQKNTETNIGFSNEIKDIYWKIQNHYNPEDYDENINTLISDIKGGMPIYKNRLYLDTIIKLGVVIWNRELDDFRDYYTLTKVGEQIVLFMKKNEVI